MVGIPSSLFTTALMLVLGSTSVLAQSHASHYPNHGSPYANASPYTTSLRGQQVDYTVLYVNPVSGDDVYGNGLRQQPFKTITHALQLAQPGTVIVLAPGRYTADTGETFPLQMKPGVTLQGSPTAGQSVMILGGGNFQSESLSQQNATILMSDRSGLGYVVVSNNQNQGHGVWVETGRPVIRNNAFVANQHTGLYVANGTPTVEGNYFSENQIAGLVLYGESRAVVRSNHFESTGTAITIASTAVPEIVGNRIIQNDEGIVLLGNARPTLASNEISQNRRNGVVEVESPSQPPEQIVATANTTPTALIAASAPSRPQLSIASDPVPSNPVSEVETLEIEPSEVEPSVVTPQASPNVTVESTPVEPTSPESIPSESALSEPLPLSDGASGRVAETRPDVTTSAEQRLSREPVTQVERVETSETTTPVSIIALRNRRLSQTHRPEQRSTDSTPSASEDAIETGDTHAPIIIFDTDEPRPSQSIAVAVDESDTASPADVAPESDVDLARLPSLPTTRRLDAPSALPTALESSTDVESSTVVSSAPTRPIRSENSEQRPSISALRNRLLARNSEESTPASTSSAIGSSQPQSVPIDVIPANPSSPAVESSRRTSPPPATLSSPGSAGQRLPVPGSSIPVGRGGGHSITARPAASYDGSPPPPPSRATALGLSYRVLVEAQDDATQRRVRGLVPDAFRTRFQGRMLMQAGAYPDEATARARLQLLLNNGLDARVEYLP